MAVLDFERMLNRKPEIRISELMPIAVGNRARSFFWTGSFSRHWRENWSSVKTIFILLDSLNRNYLNVYGASWVQTPSIDRLASRVVVFDNYYCCSIPYMPVRRDLFTGRACFLETPWSPIQPWDDCLQPELRRQKGIYSYLITDHFHYFHSGGEGYHTRFDSYEFQRGQT